ncbi:serpentine type 7TM GPCR chemoreceptor srt domain-containing protein [Ditylenchus destructor]|uniref:Serpentine type 7TM GPCR chemoreceptor srt domain-containing protein n=1 Tax=Ditylenchus destructor TaxID=166010 RepID=A0AAD4QZ44_9BILA|nr:serpentine type 7TM GPCR chemoreceptor srt domain-containing protein [Ditylenchus destructor]
MSLNDFAFRYDEFMEKYNCSSYNVDTIPVEERRNVPVGVLYIVLGAICETIYLPCLWAIYQQIKLHRFSTCYIFMLYLGVCDTIGLLCTGFMCGTISLNGTVFCQSPVFFYLICVKGLFFWFAGNTTTLILAINRCLVLYDDDLADRLFKGRQGTMWLIIPTVVGILGMWVTPPFFYNPMDSSALFNPHRHYLPDDQFFHSAVHFTYNWFIVIAIPTVYIIFGVFFANKLRARGLIAIRGNMKLTKELNTFLQVLVTSFFVVTTSLGFIYQEYLESFPIFVFSGYIMYEGSPAFIYLCINQSIRNTLLNRTRKIYTTSTLFTPQPVSKTEPNAQKNEITAQ